MYTPVSVDIPILVGSSYPSSSSGLLVLVRTLGYCKFPVRFSLRTFFTSFRQSFILHPFGSCRTWPLHLIFLRTSYRQDRYTTSPLWRECLLGSVALSSHLSMGSFDYTWGTLRMSSVFYVYRTEDKSWFPRHQTWPTVRPHVDLPWVVPLSGPLLSLVS